MAIQEEGSVRSINCTSHKGLSQSLEVKHLWLFKDLFAVEQNVERGSELFPFLSGYFFRSVIMPPQS